MSGDMKSSSGPSSLKEELEAYLNNGYYPFHMPGHKRRRAPVEGLPVVYDVTELPGTDDLRHPVGMLKRAMDRTAELYGADKTWYLVNGSTCGNLAGIYAMTSFEGEIICARNCHRSIFNIIQLRHLKVHWLIPEYDPYYGIFASVSPRELASMLERFPKSEAVILTSPGYEGVVSDIQAIASVCHQYGAALFVDEAHGAHFGLPAAHGPSAFPMSAIQLGADLCVQSPHKTLQSLTQSAWLHWRKGRVDEKKIEEALSIFETSSPSWPLLLSLDGCTAVLKARGDGLLAGWANSLRLFYTKARSLHAFSFLFSDVCGNRTEKIPAHPDEGVDKFFDVDPGKILICCRDKGFNGHMLRDILRNRFGLETEMSSRQCCLAMTSPYDEDEALDRLYAALFELDRELRPGRDGFIFHWNSQDIFSGDCLGICSMPIAEAIEKDFEECPFSACPGRISAEYVYAYPPGIPILAPGELVTQKLIEEIIALSSESEGLFFSKHSGHGTGSLFVIREIRESVR